MDREPILDCRGVCKRYGKKTVLQDISLQLAEGEVFGFLGPNGAGKTTFIKVLLGLVTPNSGAIRVFGQDLFCARKRIMRQVGAIVEAPIFFEYLTAYQNLRALVSLNGHVPRERILEVLSMVGLEAVAHDKVYTFSYGMKQRLGIAQALLPSNRLVLLDEPTNGLDPHGIAGMRRLVRSLSDQHGIAVFVSSHLLNEVEQVCDRVMIIDRGKTVLCTRVDELADRAADTVEVRFVRDQAACRVASELGGSEVSIDVDEASAAFAFQAGTEGIPGIVKALVDAGARILAVRPQHATLEEVFLQQTGSGTSDVRIDTFRD